MNPTLFEEKSPKSSCRLEDSFSLPENQRKNPEDPFMLEHEKEVVSKWHEKNYCEDLKKLAV
jgi:hypothetical protein